MREASFAGFEELTWRPRNVTGYSEPLRDIVLLNEGVRQVANGELASTDYAKPITGCGWYASSKWWISSGVSWTEMAATASSR